MTEFKLKTAKKEAIPALIGLWGASGSGKTYSAIVLARGLVGQKGKIAVLDTENSRSKFYAELAGGWQHMDMQPPFTPSRYTEAFKACEDQGADVIVVDSMSHVWSGEGGILDQVDAKPDTSGLARWKSPKMEHHRMTNKLLRSTIPVIFCIREKEGTKQIKENGKTVIISTGPTPIAEKNFVYEMTIDLRLTKDGKYDLEKSKTIPKALRSVITSDGIVNEAMGKAIAEWSGSGVESDAEYTKLKCDGKDAAMRGMDAYTSWGKSLTAAQKDKVKSHLSEWTKEAKLVDLPPAPTPEESAAI